MSTLDSSSFKIELLKGESNYNAWRVQITDLLNELELWEYVSGATPLPSSATLVPDWKKKDAKALRQIRMRVAKEVIVYIQDASTSKEAWDTLAETFRPAGAIGTVLVRRKLFRTECSEGADVEEHLRQMREYRSELNTLGDKLSELDYSLTLLTSLPESWDSFIRGIDLDDLKVPDATSAPKITSAKLMARILQEDKRRKSRAGEPDTALAVKNTRGKSNLTCWNCGTKTN